MQVPIVKLAQEVELLNVERFEKQNRLTYVEKERDALEAGMAKAVEYLQKINEVARHKNQHFQLQL